MPNFIKRWQSSHTSNKNWVDFIFGSSQKKRKRKKSVQSQTEIVIDRSQNSIREIIINYFNFPPIEKALKKFANFFIHEFCNSFIKNETLKLKSELLLQRIKFKHELSKIYYNIYVKDETFSQDMNSSFQDFTNDDGFRQKLEINSIRKKIEKDISKSEREIKILCNTIHPKCDKLCRFENYPNVKSDIGSYSNNDKSVKLPISLKENRKKNIDAFYSFSCAVTISPLTSSNETLFDSYKERSQNEIRKASFGDNFLKENIIYVENIEEPPKYNKKAKGGSSNIYKNRSSRSQSFFSNSKCLINWNDNNRNLSDKDSSIILDVEVLECSEKNQKLSIHSNKTFSDIKTFGTHEEWSDLNTEAPIFIHKSSSNTKIGSCTLNSSNSKSTNNLNSNLFRVNGKKDINHSKCNPNFENGKKNDKINSYKSSHATEQCVVLSDTLTYPYGTFCDVLSDNCSHEKNMFYNLKKKSKNFNRYNTFKEQKQTSTFSKPTISSKLKMKK